MPRNERLIEVGRRRSHPPQSNPRGGIRPATGLPKMSQDLFLFSLSIAGLWTTALSIFHLGVFGGQCEGPLAPRTAPERFFSPLPTALWALGRGEKGGRGHGLPNGLRFLKSQVIAGQSTTWRLLFQGRFEGERGCRRRPCPPPKPRMRGSANRSKFSAEVTPFASSRLWGWSHSASSDWFLTISNSCFWINSKIKGVKGSEERSVSLEQIVPYLGWRGHLRQPRPPKKVGASCAGPFPPDALRALGSKRGGAIPAASPLCQR